MNLIQYEYIFSFNKANFRKDKHVIIRINL
jgi:hypothetical protein